MRERLRIHWRDALCRSTPDCPTPVNSSDNVRIKFTEICCQIMHFQRVLLTALLFITSIAGPAFAAENSARAQKASGMIDRTPRIAIISAFQSDLTTLLANVKGPKKRVANGVEFTTGTLGGKRVVLFLSGISMTNAAMNTQLVLDRFNVTHIVAAASRVG